MERKDLIERITALLKEIGGTLLSSKCGKYHSIECDGKKCYVIGLVGKKNYSVCTLNQLGVATITKIYDDLKVDFDI